MVHSWPSFYCNRGAKRLSGVSFIKGTISLLLNHSQWPHLLLSLEVRISTYEFCEDTLRPQYYLFAQDSYHGHFIKVSPGPGRELSVITLVT
jgi:hypothetical protein